MSDFKKIKAFAMDVDGVMTNGGILADNEGQLYRTFDSKDGFGVRMARMHDYPVGIITGGRAQSICARMKTIGVPPEDVYLGSRNKMEDFEDFCKRHNLKYSDVMFFGDDVPDIEVMQAAGLGICPGDACEDTKAIADIVSERLGGHSFVREYIEKVMKARGDWTFSTKTYKEMF